MRDTLYGKRQLWQSFQRFFHELCPREKVIPEACLRAGAEAVAQASGRQESVLDQARTDSSYVKQK